MKSFSQNMGVSHASGAYLGVCPSPAAGRSSRSVPMEDEAGDWPRISPCFKIEIGGVWQATFKFWESRPWSFDLGLASSGLVNFCESPDFPTLFGPFKFDMFDPKKISGQASELRRSLQRHCDILYFSIYWEYLSQ